MLAEAAAVDPLSSLGEKAEKLHFCPPRIFKGQEMKTAAVTAETSECADSEGLSVHKECASFVCTLMSRSKQKPAQPPVLTLDTEPCHRSRLIQFLFSTG